MAVFSKIHCSLFSGLLLLSTLTNADSGINGVWKTYDDETGKPKALVRIFEEGGIYSGRIVRLLDPTDPPDAVCEACSDYRHGQPVLGLIIIRNLRPQEAPRSWGDGEILDPEDGHTYRLHIKLAEDNRRLEVRGYIGMPLLGRTQRWTRVEDSSGTR